MKGQFDLFLAAIGDAPFRGGQDHLAVPFVSLAKGRCGEPVMYRIAPERLARVDAWREQQYDTPTRPEAIRRLVEKAL